MAALNPPGSIPGEADIILRLLAATRTKRLPRQYVDRLVTPEGLTPATSRETAGEDSDTMDVLRSTNLVRRDGDDLVLGDALASNLDKKDGNPSLNTAVRRTLLTVVPAEDARSSNEGAGDLARAAAWLLLQDPWTPIQGWQQAEELQQRQLNLEHYTLVNGTRWGPLD